MTDLEDKFEIERSWNSSQDLVNKVHKHLDSWLNEILRINENLINREKPFTTFDGSALCLTKNECLRIAFSYLEDLYKNLYSGDYDSLYKKSPSKFSRILNLFLGRNSYQSQIPQDNILIDYDEDAIVVQESFDMIKTLCSRSYKQFEVDISNGKQPMQIYNNYDFSLVSILFEEIGNCLDIPLDKNNYEFLEGLGSILDNFSSHKLDVRKYQAVFEKLFEKSLRETPSFYFVGTGRDGLNYFPKIEFKDEVIRKTQLRKIARLIGGLEKSVITGKDIHEVILKETFFEDDNSVQNWLWMRRAYYCHRIASEAALLRFAIDEVSKDDAVECARILGGDNLGFKELYNFGKISLYKSK